METSRFFAPAAATYGGMIQAVGQAMEIIRQEMMFACCLTFGG